MLSQTILTELRTVAASFAGEGEVQLSDGRVAFLSRNSEGDESCRNYIENLPKTSIPLSGVVEVIPGVYGVVR